MDVSLQHFARLKAPISHQGAGEHQGQFRVVGGLAGQDVPGAAVGQVANPAGEFGGNPFRRLEFHSAAKRIAGQLAQQTPLGSRQQAGVGDTASGLGGGQREPGTSRAADRRKHGRPVPRPQGADERFVAAETTAGITLAVARIGDRLAHVVDQHAAGASQQRMPGGVVPAQRTADRDGRLGIACGHQGQAVRDAGHRGVASRLDAPQGGQRVGIRAGPQQHDGQPVAGSSRIAVSLCRRRHRLAVSQHRPAAFRPANQIAVVVRITERVHDPQHRHAVLQGRDTDRAASPAAEEDRRPVVRINQPQLLVRLAGRVAQLFSPIAPRKLGQQDLPDQPLGLFVDLGMPAGASRTAGPVKLGPQHRARLPSGVGCQFQGSRIIDHGTANVIQPLAACQLAGGVFPLAGSRFTTWKDCNSIFPRDEGEASCLNQNRRSAGGVF